MTHTMQNTMIVERKLREKSKHVPLQAARVQVRHKLLAAPMGTMGGMEQLTGAEGRSGAQKKI